MDKRKLSPKEEEMRMVLLKQGRSDREIAKFVGVKRDTIRHWRNIRGLPPASSIRRSKRQVQAGDMPSAHMSAVLTPEQCEVMEHFLSMLVWAHKKSGGSGCTNVSSITRFITTYRQLFGQAQC